MTVSHHLTKLATSGLEWNIVEWDLKLQPKEKKKKRNTCNNNKTTTTKKAYVIWKNHEDKWRIPILFIKQYTLPINNTYFKNSKNANSYHM